MSTTLGLCACSFSPPSVPDNIRIHGHLAIMHLRFYFGVKVSPCLLITDIPCMIQPVADRQRPGLLQKGGAHDFVDQHTVRIPPGGFPTPPGFPTPHGDNIYAAYTDAEPYQRVQPYVDFRALLVDSAVALGRSANGAQSVSSLPNDVDICALAQQHLRDLRRQGCYAMTLFEIVLVYIPWLGLT